MFRQGIDQGRGGTGDDGGRLLCNGGVARTSRIMAEWLKYQLVFYDPNQRWVGGHCLLVTIQNTSDSE